MADIQKVAQFVLRAKDEASPTIKAVGDTVRRLSNIKVENQILALDNQIVKLKASLASATTETARIGTELSKAKREGASAAAVVSEYGQNLAVAQAQTRRFKDALAQKEAQLRSLRGTTQSSFAAFSRGADALDVTSSRLDRLQRELAQTKAGYQQATAAAGRYLQAQRTAPGLSNQFKADAAIAEAREFKAAMADIQAEINATNATAQGSFLAFSKAANAMEIQTTEAVQLAPAIEQNTSNAQQNAAAQTAQRRAIEATTAAMQRQQQIAQRSVGGGGGGGGGMAGGGIGGLFDDANDSYATSQGRGPLGLRPYELTNLGYQINDVVSGLAMGQPPVQIFAQQFGQIAQLFPAVTAGILKFLPVLGAIGVTIVAPIARLNTFNTSLETFERQLAISVDGALYSAARLAGFTQQLDDMGVAVDEARTAISTMIKAGVVEGQIRGLVLASKELASITGSTLPEAAEKMAQAFTGGIDGVRELDQELNFLTASQYEQITAMFDAGREAEGYAAALSALENRMDPIANKADGPWSQAIDNLGNAWNNFMQWMSETVVIDMTIKALDALGVAVETLTGLLPGSDGTPGPRVNASGSLMEQLGGMSDADLDREIADTQKRVQDALSEKKNMVEMTVGLSEPDTSVIDATIADLQRELEYLQKLRETPVEDRRSLNFDPYETSQPDKTAEDWAAQMNAVEAGHARVNEATQEQKKNQIDVNRSIEEMLEDRQQEAELAAMTGKEQYVQQGILEAMNIAKEKGLELDETALQNLRERLGVLYEMKNAGDPSQFETEFTNRRFSGAGANDEELVVAAVEVAKRLGVNAKDILTAISYETGGTLDPWQKGPTTQWGEHRGLIQWGEPQREQYGVTEMSTITEQMMAVGKYLADSGVKAGDGLLQIYAAINAGDASRVNASDANNGGAPGTVTDKVRDQMSDHQARAEGLLAAYAGMTEEAEKRVESELRSNEAFAERKADMEFELAQAGRPEREAAIQEALRNAEKARGRALTAEEKRDVEALAAATYDATNAERLRQEEGKRLEEEVNMLLERQALLREQIAYFQQTGNMEAASSAELELTSINEKLVAATEAAKQFWSSMGGPGSQAAILALQKTQFELGKLDTRFLMTGEQMNEFIATSATNAFKKFAEAIANGENAAASLGDAFREMAANIIMRIGEMIVQQAIFNAISGMFGGMGLGGWIMGGVGMLFHSGGVAGSGVGPSRTISAGAWAAAPRYHEGGIAGLKPGEVPAILKKGEEVLTEDNPRHIGNGGGMGGDTAVINAIDAPSFVEAALSTAQGRKVILNYMRSDRSAVRSALGV